MFVTTAIAGSSKANEPSDSSASVTNHGEVPSWAFASSVRSMPPSTRLASMPPTRNTACVMAVVVVFPCVPQIAMPRLPAISCASISPRCSTVVPFRLAATHSALPRSIAELTTTARAPRTFSPRWPIVTDAPSRRSSSTSGVALTSEPDTASPRANRMRAMALMPMPPMPTKWTGCLVTARLFSP